nr:MAG TPA: hypothetical protein [Caudoviricetes sp.]
MLQHHHTHAPTGAQRIISQATILRQTRQLTLRRPRLHITQTRKQLTMRQLRRHNQTIQLLTELHISITTTPRLSSQRIQNQINPVLNRRHIITQIRPMVIRRLLRSRLRRLTDSRKLSILRLPLLPRPRPPNRNTRRETRQRHHQSSNRVNHLSVPPPRMHDDRQPSTSLAGALYSPPVCRNATTPVRRPITAVTTSAAFAS